MTNDSAIYFVDVYVPNEGEMESSLELAVFRLSSLEIRPSIYIHTYLQPVNYNLNRIRWRDAAHYGISQETISSNNWPSINDILQEDYLKHKNVVCFSEAAEPVQSLTKNAHRCYSVVQQWHQVFASKPAAMAINDYEDMLKYIGLPIKDESNTNYTPLMKRMFAQIAIWIYLLDCESAGRIVQIDHDFLGFNFWPLQRVPDPWYTGNPKTLSDIPTDSLNIYFSNRLPDFIDWSKMCVYRHDWTFGRDRQHEVKISAQDAMINFIFNQLFDLKTRLFVLVFYSIYNDRVSYARTIALQGGTFNNLPNSIREDFFSFVILHLDDFLSRKQKQLIISALAEQVIKGKAEERVDEIDYDEIKRHSPENGISYTEEFLPKNQSICWYRELHTKEEVLYRGFLIKGSLEERIECGELISKKLASLLKEAKDPLSECWLNNALKQWIKYITGFSWQELNNPPRINDSETLVNTRKSIRNIIAKFSTPFYTELRQNISDYADKINDVPEGDKATFRFIFQGVEVVIVVDNTAEKLNLLQRLLKKF